MTKVLPVTAALAASPSATTPLPRPKIGGMGYNPANFAFHIGAGRWTPGYRVSYAITFVDARTGRESPRSRWWGPRTDPKHLYGGFGLIRIPTDVTGQATSRRIWRQFDGGPVECVGELLDNETTKYQDASL
jgi:hypothetical protein